jgi:hypothetical protein
MPRKQALVDGKQVFFTAFVGPEAAGNHAHDRRQPTRFEHGRSFFHLAFAFWALHREGPLLPTKTLA